MTHGRQPETSMEAVADKVVAAGVRHVTGSVVGDGSRYDAQRTAGNWPARFVGQGLVANLGALMVNDAWTVDPIDPNGAKGGAAPDPAAHAAAVLTQLLQARGVQVDGPPTSGAAPATTTTIVEVPSLTIRELVDETLAFSDNTSAELLLKELGAAKGGAGSTAAGLKVVEQWLTAQGLPTDGVTLVDGSGLSDQDRVTCALLSALLQRSGPDGELAKGLAQPGQPGTLDDRFTSGDLKGRLRAKTGTLKNVAALSGWLTTVPGRPLQFSILENTAGRDVQAADLSVQNDLLKALLPYPQSPPADQLGPRPPVAT
jgi:D-alanyl-D-alanine carboxypeptidase/D-alanyl-D-alanine-endopeptidase (penicillin-binding protein 4)